MDEEEIKEIIEKMLDSTFIFNGNKVILRDFLKKREEENIEFDKNTNSYEKFCSLAACLLLRNQSGTVFRDGQEYYKSNLLFDMLIKTYPNLQDKWGEKKLFALVEESGYSAYKTTAPIILLEAKKIFMTQFDSDIALYIEQAEKKMRNHYDDDPFLKIKGVGYKTRDLGLSNFSDNFLAVDRHLLRVPYLTGLSNFSDIDSEIWQKDSVTKKEYRLVAEFLVKIAQISNITPKYLDRLFWNFSKRVCKETDELLIGNCKKLGFSNVSFNKVEDANSLVNSTQFNKNLKAVLNSHHFKNADNHIKELFGEIYKLIWMEFKIADPKIELSYQKNYISFYRKEENRNEIFLSIKPRVSSNDFRATVKIENALLREKFGLDKLSKKGRKDQGRFSFNSLQEFKEKIGVIRFSYEEILDIKE